MNQAHVINNSAVAITNIKAATGEDHPCGNFPNFGPRVAFINVPVQIPIKSHGCAACKNHTQNHQAQGFPIESST